MLTLRENKSYKTTILKDPHSKSFLLKNLNSSDNSLLGGRLRKQKLQSNTQSTI